MLLAAIPLNAFCPSAALLKHISPGPAYRKCARPGWGGGPGNGLGERERERSIFCVLFCSVFIQLGSEEIRTLIFKTKLRHQRTTCCAAPTLQLDPLWIKLSGMFSLPVCVCMNGPYADTYKLMQYAKMKAVPVLKGFSIRGWEGWKSMLSVPSAVHHVAGDSSKIFFPPLRWNSLQLSLFCKWLRWNAHLMFLKNVFLCPASHDLLSNHQGPHRSVLKRQSDKSDSMKLKLFFLGHNTWPLLSKTSERVLKLARYVGTHWLYSMLNG